MIAVAFIALAVASLHVVQAANWRVGEWEARYYPKGWVVPARLENPVDSESARGRAARDAASTYYGCLEQYYKVFALSIFHHARIDLLRALPGLERYRRSVVIGR